MAREEIHQFIEPTLTELMPIAIDKMSIYCRDTSGQYWRIIPMARPWEHQNGEGCSIISVNSVPASATHTSGNMGVLLSRYWGTPTPAGKSWNIDIHTPAGPYSVGVIDRTAVLSSAHHGPVGMMDLGGAYIPAAAVILWAYAAASDSSVLDRPAQYWAGVLEAAPIGADMATTAHFAAGSAPLLEAVAASPALANQICNSVYNIFAAASWRAAKHVNPRPCADAVRGAKRFIGASSTRRFSKKSSGDWVLYTNEHAQILGAPKPIALWRMGESLTGVLAGTYLHAIDLPLREAAEQIEAQIFGPLG